jgi:hypothetical protein
MRAAKRGEAAAKRASRSVAISSGSAKPAHWSCSTRSRAICRLCSPWLKPGRIAMRTQWPCFRRWGGWWNRAQPGTTRVSYAPRLETNSARKNICSLSQLQRNSVMQPVSPTTFQNFSLWTNFYHDWMASRISSGRPGGNLARRGAQNCATTANGEFHVRSANRIGLRTECRRRCCSTLPRDGTLH